MTARKSLSCKINLLGDFSFFADGIPSTGYPTPMIDQAFRDLDRHMQEAWVTMPRLGLMERFVVDKVASKRRYELVNILNGCYGGVERRTMDLMRRTTLSTGLPRVPWKEFQWGSWQGQTPHLGERP